MYPVASIINTLQYYTHNKIQILFFKLNTLNLLKIVIEKREFIFLNFSEYGIIRKLIAFINLTLFTVIYIKNKTLKLI